MTFLLPRKRLIEAGAAALACAFLFPRAATPHDVITTKVTWSREISRLVYKRCISCHREGGTSFPLVTYEQARPWAKAMKDEALERRMPPWGAVKGFGEFRDDQGLTQEQIELIADWVEGGAPEGDAALMPKMPEPPMDVVPPHGAGIVVDGSIALKTAVTLTGIRPKAVAAGASLQVIAQRPDGSIEPLLWLYDFHPEFARSYFYRKALLFPAGTKIEVAPMSGGTVALLVQDTKRASSKKAPAPSRLSGSGRFR